MQKYAPLRAEDTNGDGQPDSYYYVVRKYKDSIVPAITLSLALEYFNKTFSDVQVVLEVHTHPISPVLQFGNGPVGAIQTYGDAPAVRRER